MIPPTPRSLVRLLFSLVALSAFFLPAAVHADDPPTPISAGAGADWGVKQSFRNYVTGPIANGTISIADGATQNPDGTFHFPVGAGEYDPTTGTTVLGFTGTVHFEGHEGALEVTISDPRIELTPEGSALFADMTSKPNQPGAPVTQYPGVKVAALDLSGKAPTVDATTTTWPALPTALAEEAVPAFAGFYGANTALDSFAFGYEGPGGVPQSEDWTPAATPLWGKALTGTIPTGVVNATFDPVRDRIWVGAYDGKKVVALNDETMASAGIDVSVGHSSRAVAVDRTNGTVYSIDTDIRAVRDSGSGYALDPTAVDSFGGGSNALATDPATGTIYTVVENSLYRYKSPGFSRESFEIPSGYGAVRVTEDGRIFLIPSGAVEVAEVTISGATATLKPVPGTTAASGATVAADGRIAYVELDYSEYPIVHTTLHVLTPDGSGGWSDHASSQLKGVSSAYGAWSGDGETLFLVSSGFTDVIVVEDDVEVGRIKGNGYLSAMQPAPDGSVYALWRDGTMSRLGVVATSPTITEQPDDASVTLASAEATKEVELTAAAEGDPAPDVRWQVRAPGSARWNDVEGATEATLAVELGVADSGARYRAIFGNEAGEIATVPAIVSAQVEPPSDPGTGGPGGDPLPVPPATGTTVKPKIGGVAATRKVGNSRQVTVAQLACPSGGASCKVKAPRKVTIRIDGQAFKVTVRVPKSIAPGASASLRVRLPKAAAERLAGQQTTLRLKVTVGTPPTQTTRTIKVTLKKP